MQDAPHPKNPKPPRNKLVVIFSIVFTISLSISVGTAIVLFAVIRSPQVPITLKNPPPPPPPPPLSNAIIFSLQENNLEACINSPDYQESDSLTFHAWLPTHGRDIPMQATSDDSCMYWVRLPAGSEGGTLKVNDSFILNVTDFSVEAGEGCDTVAMIGEGNVIESNDTSLIGQPDSENNDSVKWGWVCKR